MHTYHTVLVSEMTVCFFFYKRKIYVFLPFLTPEILTLSLKLKIIKFKPLFMNNLTKGSFHAISSNLTDIFHHHISE